MLDVFIIGAGPIGLACGIEAAKANLTYQIVDKGTLVNSLYNYPLGMTFFSTSNKLEIGDVPFISHNPKPTRSEALEYYRRVADKWQLKINLYEEVIDVNPLNDFYEITTTKGAYRAINVVLAMGFYDLPHLMNIPGEDLKKVSHYYKEPHPFYGQKLAIIGAANSAVDAALECYRKGADVTMIIRGDKIGDNVKYWVKPDIENRIKEGSIKAYFNATPKSITESHIIINTNDVEVRLENDFVLAMTGYEPNFDFLEKIGINILPDDKCVPVHNTETMETNMPNIYLAGVICGGLETNKWFIENSRIHAVNIMQKIIGKSKVLV